MGDSQSTYSDKDYRYGNGKHNPVTCSNGGCFQCQRCGRMENCAAASYDHGYYVCATCAMKGY